MLSGRSYRPAQLRFDSGRRTKRQPLRPSNCAYYEGNLAKLAGAHVGPDAVVADGYIDTRRVTFTVDFRTPQHPGQLSFPLNRLNAGAGFVLDLRGMTKDESGLKKSEGTVRITFVPRPS